MVHVKISPPRGVATVVGNYPLPVWQKVRLVGCGIFACAIVFASITNSVIFNMLWGYCCLTFGSTLCSLAGSGVLL
jgi:hypothetical protein